MKLDLTSLFSEAARLGQAGWDQASDYLQSGTRYLSESLSGLSLFGSTERLAARDRQDHDEKHYFLVPFRLEASGYAVYTMRCLPQGVPPINDLPKRRVLHLPSASSLEDFDALMKGQARKDAEEGAKAEQEGSLGGRLNDLADKIDKLDDRVFGGLLLIGGLVALVNPVAGAVIAAKSLIPSGALLLSKFGLRSVGETLNERKLAADVRKAERDVLAQFRAASAQSLVNPVLAQLQLALETTAQEFEPLYDAEFPEEGFCGHDAERLIHLSYRAICNVYEETVGQADRWEAAGLGPEDLAWLQSMREQCAAAPHSE